MADSQKGSEEKRKAVIPNVIPSKKKKIVIDEETTNKTNQNDESTSNGNFKSQIMEKLEELKCNICTEILIRPVVLNCSHTFCEYCITKWKRQQQRCPICFERIESLVRVLVLDVYIEKTLEVLSPDENRARKEIINQREQTKTLKPRRPQRLRNRRQSASVSAAYKALKESHFHLRALIDEVSHLANHFIYD